MKIFFAESNYEIPDAFRHRYEAELRRAHDDALALLPFASKHINFFVQPREYDLIDVTNDNARVHNSDFVEVAFNPTLDQAGMDAVIADIRPTIFHEMNHAARFAVPIWHNSFVDSCLMEGLASVFSREHTGESAPWAEYANEDVGAWLKEIRDLGDRITYNEYMYGHPDGRRWIGYKVGTYIVDEAIKKSGKSVIELTSMECADILTLAGV